MLRSLLTQPGPGARTTYFPKKSYTGALPPGQPSLPPPAVGPGNRALGRGVVCVCVHARASLGTTGPRPVRQRPPINRAPQLLTRHSWTRGLQAGRGVLPAGPPGARARSRPEGSLCSHTHPGPHPRRRGTPRCSPTRARFRGFQRPLAGGRELRGRAAEPSAQSGWWALGAPKQDPRRAGLCDGPAPALSGPFSFLSLGQPL